MKNAFLLQSFKHTLEPLYVCVHKPLIYLAPNAQWCWTFHYHIEGSARADQRIPNSYAGTGI